MTDAAWTLPLVLARAAWADLPYDSLVDRFLEPRRAHLLVVTGDPVAPLKGVDPARGPASLLPPLVALLRAVRGHPAPESLSLLTAIPGDVSSVPSVPALVGDVTAVGVATLVRDPRTSEAVLVTREDAGPDVVRWTARGIGRCPVAPQPPGPGEAGAALTEAVLEAARLVRAATAANGSAGATAVDLERHVTPVPPGLPSRVLDLVDRADRIDAIVAAALSRPGEGHAVSEREPVLRRLQSTVDAARRAAVAAAGEDALAGVGSR